MQQLVRNLGDHFNLPVDQIAELDLDEFVDAAIKVEAGELATLRVRSFLPYFKVCQIQPSRFRLQEQSV